MSALFALVAVALTLLVTATAMSLSYQNSGSTSAQLDEIMDLFGHGLEISSFVPFFILIALFVAVLGVWGRI